eukprot:GEMP01037639.1.p1 GENE.GEMP01037639.1~~GEMP01037639.1.p1  ORF type:complete len:370 (+),score=66.76 GEMP01037639.1:28-1110(+)
MFLSTLWFPVIFGENLLLDADVHWSLFLNKFNKTYRTETEEHDKRLGVFKKNVDFINRENAKNNSYVLGIGPFADLTIEEFRDQIRAKRPTNLWGNLKRAGVHVKSGDVPDEIDWTTKNAVTEVKNQGLCGSCWAFSVTGAIEGAFARVKGGRLASLSEQNLLDCDDRDNKCDGGVMDRAFEYVMANGICSESSYPYQCDTADDCSSTTCHSTCDKVIEAGTLDGYLDVVSKSDADLMSALAQQPVSVSIEADSPVFQHYRSGILTSPACGEETDHGVLAVGYGVENGVHYWKLKNSWGVRWGDSGYVRLEKDTVWDNQGGICGILRYSSYPLLVPINGARTTSALTITFLSTCMCAFFV